MRITFCLAALAAFTQASTIDTLEQEETFAEVTEQDFSDLHALVDQGLHLQDLAQLHEAKKSPAKKAAKAAKKAEKVLKKAKKATAKKSIKKALKKEASKHTAKKEASKHEAKKEKKHEKKVEKAKHQLKEAKKAVKKAAEKKHTAKHATSKAAAKEKKVAAKKAIKKAEHKIKKEQHKAKKAEKKASKDHLTSVLTDKTVKKCLALTMGKQHEKFDIHAKDALVKYMLKWFKLDDQLIKEEIDDQMYAEDFERDYERDTDSLLAKFLNGKLDWMHKEVERMDPWECLLNPKAAIKAHEEAEKAAKKKAHPHKKAAKDEVEELAYAECPFCESSYKDVTMSYVQAALEDDFETLDEEELA